VRSRNARSMRLTSVKSRSTSVLVTVTGEIHLRSGFTLAIGRHNAGISALLSTFQCYERASTAPLPVKQNRSAAGVLRYIREGVSSGLSVGRVQANKWGHPPVERELVSELHVLGKLRANSWQRIPHIGAPSARAHFEVRDEFSPCGAFIPARQDCKARLSQSNVAIVRRSDDEVCLRLTGNPAI
jgi:hypothetical protein